MSDQTPHKLPEIVLKPAEDESFWPSRKRRADVWTIGLAVVLAAVVLAATVPKAIPDDAEPERIADKVSDYDPVPSALRSPQAAAIERLNPHGDLDVLTLLYMHAACWPEQYGGRPPPPFQTGITVPCPIPAAELPHPGPLPGDVVPTTTEP